MTAEQTNILIFLVSVFGLGGLVFAWVVIDHLRQLLDALNTLVLRESERRNWARGEHRS